jgi:hypothetical protein
MSATGTPNREEACTGPAFYQRIVDVFSRDVDFSPTITKLQALLDALLCRAMGKIMPYIVALIVLLLANAGLQAALLWWCLRGRLPVDSPTYP